MAAVRTFTLPHYEAYPVQVALFTDVRNAEFLRSQLLAANPEFDYAFVDAAMVSQFCFLRSDLYPRQSRCSVGAHVSSHDRLTPYPDT